MMIVECLIRYELLTSQNHSVFDVADSRFEGRFFCV